MPPQIENQTESIKPEQEIALSKPRFPRWAKYILVVAGSILLLTSIALGSLWAYFKYKSDHIIPYMPTGGSLEEKGIKETMLPNIDGLKWEEDFSEEKKERFNAIYFNDNLTKRGTIPFSGRLWSVTSSENKHELLYDFESKLRDHGWAGTVKLNNDDLKIQFSGGDSVTDHIWGYLKLEGNKIRLIGFYNSLIEYVDKNEPDSVGFNYECPCKWKILFFESEPVDVSDLIDGTIGWKTYKNTKYGYEFKYPDNVGIVNEMTSEYAGPPINPEEDMLLIADKEKTFYFTVTKGNLKIEKRSPLGESVLSTFIPISILNNGTVIPPVIDGVDWKELPSKGENIAHILRSDIKTSEYGYTELPGRFWTATTSKESDFFGNLDTGLRTFGWSGSVSLDDKNIIINPSSADGPRGSDWGYVKMEGNKLKTIGFSVRLIEYVDKTEPDSVFIYDCPCKWKISVFESEPVDINNLSF